MPTSVSEKIGRVLIMLRGMSYARVATKLAPFGFDQDVLDEGWGLLRKAATARGAKLPPTTTDPTLIVKVDEWENRYLPIADATLSRHYPEIHASIFRNLSQTEGPEVLVSVQLFVERISALEKADDKKSKAARDLLKKRGLTKAAIDQAKGMLSEATVVGEAPENDLEESAAAIEAAELELWGWYLEWSKIARATIKDGRLLQLLGFGRRGGGSAAVVEEEDEEEPVPAPVEPPISKQIPA